MDIAVGREAVVNRTGNRPWQVLSILNWLVCRTNIILLAGTGVYLVASLVSDVNSSTGEYRYSRRLAVALLICAILGLTIRIVYRQKQQTRNPTQPRSIRAEIATGLCLAVLGFAAMYRVSWRMAVGSSDLPSLYGATVLSCHSRHSLWLGDGDLVVVLEMNRKNAERLAWRVAPLEPFDKHPMSWGNYFLMIEPPADMFHCTDVGHYRTYDFFFQFGEGDKVTVYLARVSM